MLVMEEAALDAQSSVSQCLWDSGCLVACTLSIHCAICSSHVEFFSLKNTTKLIRLYIIWLIQTTVASELVLHPNYDALMTAIEALMSSVKWEPANTSMGAVGTLFLLVDEFLWLTSVFHIC